MSKSKNILFITHSNNDLDHFLPLFVEFKKDKTKNITALAFYNKVELMKNQLHKYICNENDIHLESFTDIFGLKPLSQFITRLYKYSSINVKNIQYTGSRLMKIKKRLKTLIFSHHDSLIRTMYYLSKKYIVLFSIFLTKHRHIEEYFSDKNFALIVIDLRSIDEEDFKLKPLNKMLKIMKGEMKTDDDIMFRFLAVARENGIPTLAIPHGPCYEYIEVAFKDYKSPFRVDFTIHCNKIGKSKDRLILGLKKDLLLGDPRYDPNWIDYIESVAKKTHSGKVKKQKDKIIVLYIASYISEHSYHINTEYHQQIHKDILSLVNDFPEMEIWMKFHPRLVYKVPIEEYIDKERQKNIRFFENDVDTNLLMPMADIVVSPKSSTLTIPILRKKPLLYYDRWKEKTGDIVVITFFDECPFILKASNYEELKQQLDYVLHGGKYHVTDKDVTFFYKKMFTVNSPYANMTKKFIKTINDILEKKI